MTTTITFADLTEGMTTAGGIGIIANITDHGDTIGFDLVRAADGAAMMALAGPASSLFKVDA